MKLRTAILTCVLILAATVLAVEFGISKYIVSRGFEELEHDQVTRDVRKVKNEIQYNLVALDSFLWDWSSWDDTYDFAWDGNLEYLDSNLGIETFQDQPLNIIVIRDKDDDIVFARAVNEEGEWDTNLLADFLATTRGLSLPPISTKGGFGGLISTAQGPILFAQRPILLSSGKGTPAGRFIMARLVTDEMLSGIKTRLGLEFKAYDTEDIEAEKLSHHALNELEAGIDPYVEVQSKDTILGYALIHDIIGIPAMVIELSAQRRISQHGNRIENINIVLTASALALYTGLIIILLRRRVIFRVEDLNKEVQAIDLSGKNIARVSGQDNKDEISQLALSINAMLQRIENDHIALSRARDGLEEEVRARTVELEKANQGLKSLDKAKSHFLSATSHELRTPLTAIHGFIKLMERTFERHFLPHLKDETSLANRIPTHLENYKIVHAETDRLGRLIDDLLDLNKIEAGKIEWRDENIEVAVLVNGAVDAITGQFETNPEVDLLSDVPDNLPRLHVDKDRVHQVLINLLNNAAKFTTRGFVKVTVRQTEPTLLTFWVEDTGPGIKQEDIPKLFELFFQSQAEDEAAPSLGTGLGLAICKEIVEHYGGTIRVESKIGKGTNFIFTLPTT